MHHIFPIAAALAAFQIFGAAAAPSKIYGDHGAAIPHELASGHHLGFHVSNVTAALAVPEALKPTAAVVEAHGNNKAAEAEDTDTDVEAHGDNKAVESEDDDVEAHGGSKAAEAGDADVEAHGGNEAVKTEYDDDGGNEAAEAGDSNAEVHSGNEAVKVEDDDVDDGGNEAAEAEVAFQQAVYEAVDAMTKAHYDVEAVLLENAAAAEVEKQDDVFEEQDDEVEEQDDAMPAAAQPVEAGNPAYESFSYYGSSSSGASARPTANATGTGGVVARTGTGAGGGAAASTGGLAKATSTVPVHAGAAGLAEATFLGATGFYIMVVLFGILEV
ncbi:hypothetical protein B0H66DRAFT_527499 [Apodospora peruviana]|uniref:Uncharacterized protein n=1 Tax=Apodospora peruviana TaxID=516989 RepID=A0AAE0ISC7_9PEZI|nr:hypothetical protein B0H66DRAFT_527499 [Apodospora peruviana]